MHVDSARLQQVLLNLLNNAIYAIGEASGTRPGEIELSCSAEGTDKVRISIRDNGIGIDEEQQHLIFTPFSPPSLRAAGPGWVCPCATGSWTA